MEYKPRSTVSPTASLRSNPWPCFVNLLGRPVAGCPSGGATPTARPHPPLFLTLARPACSDRLPTRLPNLLPDLPPTVPHTFSPTFAGLPTWTGLLNGYDLPVLLPCVCPRPLLIANGELDPRCPLGGVLEALPAARAAYSAAGVPQRLRLMAEPGRGHATSPEMLRAVREWMDMHLMEGGAGAAGTLQAPEAG
eukprot:365159-Chlamydomonas_euryale.AAC.3